MRIFGVTGVDPTRKIGTMDIDYGQETFIDANSIPLSTPEFSLNPPALLGYQYSKTIIQVPTDAIDKVSSLVYQFRPFYNSFNLPAVYDANTATAPLTLQYVGIVSVRNTVTGQITYIGPDKLLYSTFTNTLGTVFQTFPLIITTEGSVPFFAKPGDNIEVVQVGATAHNGFLRLQICNFDVIPYNKTTFGSVYHEAT